ncbi:hypothetical protein MJ389_01425 [Escherichia coli]|nr:hypothetical protein MJ389_01425 [Escherichia coli]
MFYRNSGEMANKALKNLNALCNKKETGDGVTTRVALQSRGKSEVAGVMPA